MLGQLPGAAVTKNHKPGAYAAELYRPTTLEAIGWDWVRQGWSPLRAVKEDLSHASPWASRSLRHPVACTRLSLSLSKVFPLLTSASVQISPFYKIIAILDWSPP